MLVIVVVQTYYVSMSLYLQTAFADLSVIVVELVKDVQLFIQ